MAVQDFFVWGQGGQKLNPGELSRRREIEDALLSKGPDFSPVAHWTQGLGRVADAAAGAFRRNRLGQAEADNAAWNTKTTAPIVEALLGGSSASAPVTSSAIPMTSAAGEVSATAPISSSGPQAYRDAIASIESAGSGDYSAVGPTNPKLGRALGRYQIMEANIGPWSQAALGRAVTPEEFLASPEIQDAIFDKQFGQYVEQFGPEGAAQAWFAGPGGVGKTGRKDVLGTTVGEYGQRFVNSLGPTEVAAVTPEAAIEAVAPLEAPVDVPAAPAVAEAVSAPPVQVAQASGINPAIIEALTNPQATPQTQRIAAMLLQQEQEKQQMAEEQRLRAADPLRQLQLQKGQLELEQMRNPGPQPLINAGGGAIFDPNSGEWLTAPTNGQEPPKIVELFDEATGQPYKATWDAKTGQYERVGGVKARSGMQLTTNPDGTVTLTEGAIGGLPKLTEAEGRNSGFYGRGVESHKILSDLEGEGTSLLNKVADAIPIAGNYLKGEDAQKYGQAKRDFINAVLRRESGAVISPEEFANADQQYFPQPGDEDGVIAQKRRNRETTIQGLKISAGQGAGFAVPSEQPQQQRRLKFNPATGELE